MIPNQWYVVLSSRQVRTRPVGVTRMGEKLVFWRDAHGRVACMADLCAHRGVQLSTGKVLADGHLQCPFHGFEYDASGAVTRIPANGRSAPVLRRPRHRWLQLWGNHRPLADALHARDRESARRRASPVRAQDDDRARESNGCRWPCGRVGR